MGKQIFDSTRKSLGILLLVFLVVLLTVASVSAASPKGGMPHNEGKCKSVCEGWYQQKYCDHGHWSHGIPQYWVCDPGQREGHVATGLGNVLDLLHETYEY